MADQLKVICARIDALDDRIVELLNEAPRWRSKPVTPKGAKYRPGAKRRCCGAWLRATAAC